MKLYRYIYIAGVIVIYLFQSGCSEQDKWKAVPLKIKKQESFNYSEMISGELDSTTKAELEKVRKNISDENKDLSKQLDEKRSENTSHFFKSILESMKNIYNWFINLV